MNAPVPTAGLPERLGLQLVEATPDRVVATLQVRPDLLDGSGGLHHGVISSVVETLGSIGGALWFGDRGRVVGTANATSHFSRAERGTVTAVATPVNRQDDRQLWVVDVRDEQDQPLARGELHVTNLSEAAGGGASSGHPAFRMSPQA